jgi:hypothetical protein
VRTPTLMAQELRWPGRTRCTWTSAWTSWPSCGRRGGWPATGCRAWPGLFTCGASTAPVGRHRRQLGQGGRARAAEGTSGPASLVPISPTRGRGASHCAPRHDRPDQRSVHSGKAR